MIRTFKDDAFIHSKDENYLQGLYDSEKISVEDISRIRFLLSDYLNTLEIILLGWDLSIIDEDIYKKEFRYLINPDKSCLIQYILSEIDPQRENYPAIYKFCDYLKKQIEDAKPSKKSL